MDFDKYSKHFAVGAAVLAAFALLVSFFALSEAGQGDIESMGLHPGSSSTLSGSLTVDDIVTTDDATIGDDIGVTGDLSVGNGTPSITLNGEDAYVEGTFEVDGASEFDGALNVDGAADFDSTVDIAGNVSDGAGTFTIADDVMVDGAADAIQIKVQGYTTQTSSLQVWEQSDGTDVGTMSNAGALDIASTLNYGSNDLYPLGWSAASDLVVCGTTPTFTATTTVDLSGSFSDVDYAVVTQITDPVATAALVTVDDPGAGTNLVVNSWNIDGSSAGSTGITAFYCAFGDE